MIAARSSLLRRLGREVEVREGTAPVEASAFSGGIHLTLPAAFSGQLDARARHGTVHCELPVAASQASRKQLSGQIGEGGEATVKLRTSSGNIYVKAG